MNWYSTCDLKICSKCWEFELEKFLHKDNKYFSELDSLIFCLEQKGKLIIEFIGNPQDESCPKSSENECVPKETA